jgi:hypothetical protein
MSAAATLRASQDVMASSEAIDQDAAFLDGAISRLRTSGNDFNVVAARQRNRACGAPEQAEGVWCQRVCPLLDADRAGGRSYVAHHASASSRQLGFSGVILILSNPLSFGQCPGAGPARIPAAGVLTFLLLPVKSL